MTKPYYQNSRAPQEFLEHCLRIYSGDYQKSRARKIISLFPTIEDAKVLDVGCGGGVYSLAASKKKCKDIVLADVSPVCVEAAKLNLMENTGSNPDGVVADAADLPFRNKSFDFVICIDVIEHVLRDDVLLRSIWRVLKNNGLMLIATQNSNSINYILEAPIQRYVSKNRSWMGWDPTHIRFYNPKRLHQALRNSGFHIIDVGGTYLIPYMLTLWLKRINQGISKIAYHTLYMLDKKLEKDKEAIQASFGWGIICLCQKQR